VGRICMDAFMVDITDIPDCSEGDEVVILGRMNDEKIDAHDLGQWSGSFSYEILSRWSRRLPRIYL
jgi:alanine racemase